MMSACLLADGTARFRWREAVQSRHLGTLFHRRKVRLASLPGQRDDTDVP